MTFQNSSQLKNLCSEIPREGKDGLRDRWKEDLIEKYLQTIRFRSLVYHRERPRFPSVRTTDNIFETPGFRVPRRGHRVG